ncbi:MAG: cobalt-precorrin-6A reductase [Dongiaceae bacterium]
MAAKLLILGGTTEGAALARALAAHPEIACISSLAGRTAAPAPLPGETRSGGFGGAAGLVAFLRAEDVKAMVDATHPFATQISTHAVAAARATGVPLLRIERPAWKRQPGDRWIEVGSLAEAAVAAPSYGRRCFLTVGPTELQAFASLANMRFLVRLLEKPAAPLPLADARIVIARGPFTLQGEEKLLKQHAIEVIVAKNSGGDATYGKIAAARALGLPVVMIRRPAKPPADERAETVADAAAWVLAQLG